MELHNTFFDALNSVVQGKNDLALVPSAFPQFADCVFDFPQLSIVDSFMMPLKDLVIAKRKGIRKIRTIAIHPATKALVKTLGKNVQVIEVVSKPLAAKMASEGKADSCIAPLDVAQELGLEIIHRFNRINMSWAMFGRKQ